MNRAASAAIIILNYNYARFLRRSLDSALQQTWPRVEVIVVDDGSTDASRELIAGYGALVRPVFQEGNCGHGAGMNAGFRASSAEIVFFLDADDFLYPHAVERVMRSRSPDAAQYQHRLDLVDAEGCAFDTYPARETAWEDGDVVPALLRRGRYSTTVTSGLTFERRALEAILPMDPEAFRQGGDGYLVTTAPLYGSVVTIEETLGAYRLHGVNHSQSAVGARANWRIWHDARRYEALEAHARRLGLACAPQLWRNDPIHLEERAAALLLNEGPEPPKRKRRDLAWCAIRALGALPISAKRRALLAGWWLVVGFGPEPLARAALAWKLQPGDRPPVVRRLARLARILGGAPDSGHSRRRRLGAS
jgi:GT2 family glycosyltransferase